MSRKDGNKMWAEGTIEVDDHVLVESTALFIAISADHYQRVLEGLSEEQLSRLASYRFGDYYP